MDKLHEELEKRIRDLGEKIDALEFGSEEREQAVKEYEILWKAKNDFEKNHTDFRKTLLEVAKVVVVPIITTAGSAIGIMAVNSHVLRLDQKLKDNERVSSREAQSLVQKPKGKWF